MKRIKSLSFLFSLLWLSTLVSPVFAASPGSNQLPFSRLGWTRSVALQGPYASYLSHFYLPSSWKLDSTGGKLQLSINRYFSNLVAQETPTNVNGIIAGTLSASLNGTPLASFPLQNSGSQVLTMDVPVAAWSADLAGGDETLALQWDASPSCDSNLATSVTVDPDSFFDLPHSALNELPLDLAAFPRPFYAPNSPDNAPLVILVPAQPARSELQAALAVAAGMGRLSQNHLPISLLSEDQAQTADLSQSHVIQIKKQAVANETAGKMTLQPSTWNPMRAQLVISGASDAALLAAAAAVNGGIIIPSADPHFAWAETVKPSPHPVYKEDQALSTLVSEGILFTQPGSLRRALNLNLPAEKSVSADAYLDLDLNHSQLIDYLRSGVTVRINAVPLGSLRLSDVTAAGSVIRLVIPAALLHGGANLLEIEADLVPRSVCVNPSQGSIWLNVLGDSVLHLPLAGEVNTLGVEIGPLSHYSDLLSADLSTVRVVLPAKNPQVWNAAARLVASLGASDSQGGFPDVAFATDSQDVIYDGKSLLVMGSLNQLPVVDQLNALLPVPLSANVAVSLGAAFRVDPQKVAGYLELAALPSKPGGVILVVWGNNDQGVVAAANALTSPAQGKKLEGGNIAVVQDGRVAAWQAELPASAPGLVLGPTQAVSAASAQEAPAAPVRREDWLVPAIALSALLLFGLVGTEIYTLIRKTR